MMFGLSGLGLKIAIAGIVIAIATAAIGGFFMYQKSIISDLQETIKNQSEEITTLNGNIIKLETSNESLSLQLDKKAQETKDAYAEITRLRTKDIQSTMRVNEVERILNDRARNDRVSAIRTSSKASLLLRFMEKFIQCQVDNFDKVGGKCVNGKWIEEGVTDETQ